MKYLTQNRKEASLRKWEEILDYIQKRDRDIFYMLTYWSACPFCNSAGEELVEFVKVNNKRQEGLHSCAFCDLHLNKVCDTKFDVGSNVKNALESADAGAFINAARHAKIVIEAIWNSVPVEEQ